MLVASQDRNPGQLCQLGQPEPVLGDAASPVNAAAAYGAGGATVLRQSPAVSSLRASSAPALSVPPTHGSPSPHGSSLTHGASWECGSEAGMRAGDMHRSRIRSELSRDVPDGPHAGEAGKH